MRKNNRIRSIHSSLAIENNTLSLDQVTDVINGKRVLGLEREIQEVKNAFAAYDALPQWNPSNSNDLLAAHALMLAELTSDAGKFRSKGVGVYQGTRLIHMAPPAERVPHLVKQLFSWLKTTEIHPLIASAIVHYEIEFIHPFSDGNGRLGRLWQTLILSHWNPHLAHLPVESVIHREQKSYYEALSKADSMAEFTPFIEFMLSAVIASLRLIEGTLSKEPTTQTDQATDQVTDQVKRLLLCLADIGKPVSAEYLLKELGLKHRPTFRANYLRPAIEKNLVEMTQPDAPNSPTQQYQLTQKGKTLKPE